jgi:hypothetical protein
MPPVVPLGIFLGLLLLLSIPGVRDVVMAPVLWIVGPIVVRFAATFNPDPDFVPLAGDEPEIPGPFRGHGVAAGRALSDLGFRSEGVWKLTGYVPSVVAYFELFVHDAERSAAMVMGMFPTAALNAPAGRRPGARPSALRGSLYVELVSELADGVELSTLNTTDPPPDVRWQHSRRTDLPGEADLSRVWAVHRALVSRERSARVPPPADQEGWRRTLLRSVDRQLAASEAAGHLRECPDGLFRLTWRGAFSQVWAGTFPGRWLRQRRARQRAQELLSELGL